MRKIDKFICVLSGLGLVLSLIALVLLVIGSDPFIPEISLQAVISHPLVWVVVSGVIFLSTILAKSNGAKK
ncbi:MAG: hypothetical protein FWC96_04955 [Oscillospiraceae bacterium]|nr:hypothetical protein [Oscillospiraceae bacterium]